MSLLRSGHCSDPCLRYPWLVQCGRSVPWSSPAGNSSGFVTLCWWAISVIYWRLYQIWNIWKISCQQEAARQPSPGDRKVLGHCRCLGNMVLSQEKPWDVMIVRERDSDQLLLMVSGWCEFCDDGKRCVHNSKGNIPCGGQCFPQRCCSLPCRKWRGTRSDDKPSFAPSKRPPQTVVVAVGLSLDGSWPILGHLEGVWAAAPGCFMAFAAAGGLLCMAILKYPFPSPLALSSAFWIALIPNIIEDYYNLPS